MAVTETVPDRAAPTVTDETRRRWGLYEHWTNYEVTYIYGRQQHPETELVKINEGQHTIADLPKLIARRRNGKPENGSKVAILKIEAVRDSRTGMVLGCWLDLVDKARTWRELRDLILSASREGLIGERATRPAEGAILEARINARKVEVQTPAEKDYERAFPHTADIAFYAAR